MNDRSSPIQFQSVFFSRVITNRAMSNAPWKMLWRYLKKWVLIMKLLLLMTAVRDATGSIADEIASRNNTCKSRSSSDKSRLRFSCTVRI